MQNILSIVMLQLPPGTQNPQDNTPIDFTSPFDVIVYIILPICVVILYFYWRRTRKRNRDRDRDRD